jgi:arylesterase/paraoxonase
MIMAALAVIVFLGRLVWISGVVSSVPTGFTGTCRVAATLPGVEDMESANGVTFVSVGSARGADARDGIYVFSEDGKLVRLNGAPRDFHPRGIGLYRSPDGSGIFLLAVNWRSSGRPSIDSFEVINPKTSPALVAQGTIESGLLTDPQDVAAAGPGAFYVSNGSAKQNIVRSLASWGALPGSDILYFNGMSFRAVAEDLYGARGLLLTPDGAHLLVASLTTRSLKSFTREGFSGNLTEAGSLTLPAAPEKFSLDSHGDLWVAGHANLLSWRGFAANPGRPAASQIFRVNVIGGVPEDASQAYGNDGKEIAAASIAAAAGKRLLIGSSLDGKLLDCTAN